VLFFETGSVCAGAQEGREFADNLVKNIINNRIHSNRVIISKKQNNKSRSSHKNTMLL
jgi:hypothetical protein